MWLYVLLDLWSWRQLHFLEDFGQQRRVPPERHDAGPSSSTVKWKDVLSKTDLLWYFVHLYMLKGRAYLIMDIRAPTISKIFVYHIQFALRGCIHEVCSIHMLRLSVQGSTHMQEHTQRRNWDSDCISPHAHHDMVSENYSSPQGSPLTTRGSMFS